MFSTSGRPVRRRHRPGPAIRWIALSALLLAASACGDGDGDDGAASNGEGATGADATTAAPAPAEDGEPPSSLAELVAAVPPLAGQRSTVLFDLERLVDDAGLDPLTDGTEDPPQIDRIRGQLAEDWGIPQLEGGWGMASAQDWIEGLGFDPLSLDRVASISSERHVLNVIVGDIPVERSVEVVTDRSAGADVQEEDDVVLIDEPGEELEGGPDASWPLERMGRPLRYGLSPSWFTASTGSDLRDDAVDALRGGGPALIESPAWESFAAAADERRWYAAWPVSGAELVFLPDPFSEDFPVPDEDLELPPRSELTGSVLAVDGGEPLPGLAFVYRDSATAEEAVEVLARRLEETTTQGGDRWSELSPDARVTATGAVVVIELPGAPPQVTHRAILTRDDLVSSQ
jgi:hypothetical protein